MGDKKKLKITKCTISTKGVVNPGSDSFEVMLNPTDYSLDRSICYSKDKTLGKTGSDNKFSGVNASSINLKFLLDGTGTVIKKYGKSPYDVVKVQIKNLQAIIYDYNGDQHSPNCVRILWGDLLFYGNCSKFNTQYKMFKPNGDPLRADVELSFKEYISKEEQTKTKDKQSPDMTHIVIVKAGDTLPLLCNRIYDDSSYYSEVAEVNKIMNFRKLKPGTKLIFPPIR